MNQTEETGNLLQRIITKLVVLNPPTFKKDDYESIIKYKNKLIFIKRNKNSHSDDDFIPCLFYRNPNSSNYLIYFHGNSEHIFQIEFYGLDFRSYLDMNIIIVEYPGYSIYKSENKDSKIILSNAIIVYDWIKEKFKVNDEQIFVCGRSLGTASAIFLASQKKPQALFLISAFTSLKNIGKDHKLSAFVEGIFNSYKYISTINCPVLLIHGEKDYLINYKHSIYLYQELNKNNKNIVDFHLNKNMDHNNFNLKEDIISPIQNFINKNNLKSNKNVVNMSEDEINDLYKIPTSVMKLIESNLFDIDNFQFKKKIELKNAIFFTKIDNNMIFRSGSKILIYNQKNYTLEGEIDISKTHSNALINSLYQMENKNIVCGTNLGDIIIYKLILDSEDDNFEDSDDIYKEIKNISLKEIIYKIDKFLPNYICVLTKNTIKFYDDNFTEKTSIKLEQLYTNFAQISNDTIALLSYDHLSINKITENGLELINRYDNIKSNNFNNILLTTNKYIIIGGKKYIYYIDYKTNIKNKKKYDREINYIEKIHEESFLAATDEGIILHITINNDQTLKINERIFSIGKIYSLSIKNFKTILFTDENRIQLWNNSNNDGFFCNIF